MDVQYEDGTSGIHIRLSGDLDFSANAVFKTVILRLAQRKGTPVTIDLGSVTRIDSVGLGLLYIAKEESGVKIRLKSPRPVVVKMLELTEADDDFDILP